MADNVEADAGSGGKTFATDEIGGVDHPRGKLSLGPDGTANDAIAGAGAVGTGVQRVTLASDDPAVASLQIIDDWDESDRAKVNPIAGQAGVAAGAGAVGATVQRTTLASDDPAVALLATIDSDTNTIQGDTTTLVGAIYTEDAAAAANPVGGALIVIREDARAGSLTTTDGDNIAVRGNNSGELYVKTTDSDALLTTIDTDTGTIAGDTTSIDSKITACNTGAVVLAAGTAEIGKLAAGTAAIGSITNGALIGPADPSIDSYTQIAINLTTGADQVLVSSAASKQIWVYGYAFTCGDANGQTVSIQDEDNVAITGIMEFAQYGGMAVSPSGNFSMPCFKLATDKDLEIDITGGDVDGWLAYAIVSV